MFLIWSRWSWFAWWLALSLITNNRMSSFPSVLIICSPSTELQNDHMSLNAMRPEGPGEKWLLCECNDKHMEWYLCNGKSTHLSAFLVSVWANIGVNSVCLFITGWFPVHCALCESWYRDVSTGAAVHRTETPAGTVKSSRIKPQICDTSYIYIYIYI